MMAMRMVTAQFLEGRNKETAGDGVIVGVG
jgi:hypothetical protein